MDKKVKIVNVTPTCIIYFFWEFPSSLMHFFACPIKKNVCLQLLHCVLQTAKCCKHNSKQTENKYVCTCTLCPLVKWAPVTRNVLIRLSNVNYLSEINVRISCTSKITLLSQTAVFISVSSLQFRLFSPCVKQINLHTWATGYLRQFSLASPWSGTLDGVLFILVIWYITI